MRVCHSPHRRLRQTAATLLAALVLLACTASSLAQNGQPDAPIVVEAADQVDDREIERRIAEIFAEIKSLEDVSAEASAGVVVLQGATTDLEAAQRAAALASRVQGVVAIENHIQRDASLERRLAPALEETRNLTERAIRAAPLIIVALLVFVLFVFAGGRLSRWSGLWSRLTPNDFIGELLGTTVRVAFIAMGAVAALSLLDATAFLGAFLGAAGVLGLAVGFAVRDTIENYIASIMLSIRQPFQPNDHVVIDGREGKVIRLTSRATVLMTLDGNHLRIPNAMVFKAVILNYTRNPLRRFDFELGVDAGDDPMAALDLGMEKLRELEFILSTPSPIAFIKTVGDSNIVLFFAGWIDQSKTSFAKARSAAIVTVKDALESAGFSLPEPIYRLRFDNAPPELSTTSDTATPTAARASPLRSTDTADVAPEDAVSRQVEQEREHACAPDLLDTRAKQE